MNMEMTQMKTSMSDMKDTGQVAFKIFFPNEFQLFNISGLIEQIFTIFTKMRFSTISFETPSKFNVGNFL